MEEFIRKDGKALRYGFTTGTCATAATKAAAEILLSGKTVEDVVITTPKGKVLHLPIRVMEVEKTFVTCAVQKDAGDDADVTDGIWIYAKVSLEDSGYVVDGGVGIGRVTKEGLDQPVGNAAINSVPRKTIKAAMEETAETFGYTGGMLAVISAPEGVEIAKKTFNPRLGIDGGISILGTSGIVEPMSEQALLDTILTEMRVRICEYGKNIVITPGNYGQDFVKEHIGIDLEQTVKCSNFIGNTIEFAKNEGIENLLLVGHIGKLVKLGVGIMNTHSKEADARMETLTICLLEAGGKEEELRELLQKNTTEDGCAYLQEIGMLEKTAAILMARIEDVLARKGGEKVKIGAVVFSKQLQCFFMTKEAERMFQDGTFCWSGTGSC